MDEFLPPSLAQLKGDAKLRSCGSRSTPPMTCPSYVVERACSVDDGGRLYEAVLQAGADPKSALAFKSLRGTVEMAVVVFLVGQSQNLGVILDLENQRIWVNVN